MGGAVAPGSEPKWADARDKTGKKERAGHEGHGPHPGGRVF